MAELWKPSKEVSITKLQSLLEISLRNPGSTAATEADKEDVRVEISGMSLVEQLLKISNVAGSEMQSQLDSSHQMDDMSIAGNELKKMSNVLKGFYNNISLFLN